MSEAMNISSSPHVRDKWTTPYIMRVVLMSLMPATCVGIIAYGWQALAIIVLAVVSAVATELLFNLICHKPVTVWDGSAAVTGLLLGLSLGPRTPLYLPVIGSAFAIAVVKGCFGGLGKNFINPALAGRCFLLLSFAGQMSIGTVLDASTSATPMMALRQYETVDISRMFLGTADGVIGSSILALLIGGLVLWSMDIIHGQICFSVLGGFSLFIVLFGGHGLDLRFLLAHICGGGVVMGAFFMATDYVTSPVSRLGQFIYGCLIGVLGGIFRLYGNTADSFSYAIVIGNVCTPLIDTYIVQKPFTYRRGGVGRMCVPKEVTKTVRKPVSFIEISKAKARASTWKTVVRPVVALTIIALIAGLALSSVYSVTKEPIEKQELAKKTAAFETVCPGEGEFEELLAAADLLAAQDETATPRVTDFYVKKAADGTVAGYAMSITTKGFGGDLVMAVGLTPDGAIQKIDFTTIQETAGLGMRAKEDPSFTEQFVGKSGQLVLNQDVDALTGATVTSTAVVNGVNAGLEFFETVTKGGQ